MSQLTEIALRREIKDTMGREIPSRVWGILRTMHRVSAVLQGDYLKEDLIQDIENLTPYEGYLIGPARGSRTEPEGEIYHAVAAREASAYPELDALSEIMGIEASKNPEVIGFRKDILGGSLVPPMAVAEWIREEHEKAKGRPLSSQTDPDQAVMASQVGAWRGGPCVPRPAPDWPGRPRVLPEDTLDFPDTSRARWQLDLRTRSVPVPARGPLWFLKFVSLGLMEEYPWSEPQAVGFILAGVPPRLPTVSISQYRLFPFRIVLDVDPGLDAKRVYSEYRRAQRELVQVKRRAKGQGEKHLRLAVFAAKGRNGTWNDMMEAWNEHSRPEWAYRDSRQFQKDAHKSLAALRRRRDRVRMPSPYSRTEHTYGLR